MKFKHIEKFVLWTEEFQILELEIRLINDNFQINEVDVHICY